MKRLALATMGLVSPLILVAFLVGGRFGEWTFALSVVIFPAAVCALGARTAGSRWVVGLLPALLGLSLLGVRATAPGTGASSGLPAATWWMLLGLGLAPLLLVTLGYAVTFRRPRSPDGG